jgi:hypothetical protein
VKGPFSFCCARFTKPHANPVPVLRDEIDAGRFKSLLDSEQFFGIGV